MPLPSGSRSPRSPLSCEEAEYLAAVSGGGYLASSFASHLAAADSPGPCRLALLAAFGSFWLLVCRGVVEAASKWGHSEGGLRRLGHSSLFFDVLVQVADFYLDVLVQF